ncbi:MAG TPA: hypothetical protein VHQ24_05435 [Lachnospiraceae bacterium]|nr:hypothetical protein [Lachnospiraceae bacterium]
MDSFGKIVSIFIAVILLFLFPLQYMAQKQELLLQSYIMKETSYFIDSVRNLGYMTKDMYETYYKKISLGSNSYDIEITHYKYGLYYDEEDITSEEYLEHYSCTYTEDIFKTLSDGNHDYRYLFNQYDYVTISVYRKNVSFAMRLQLLLAGRSGGDRECITIYGGMIRDEIY